MSKTFNPRNGARTTACTTPGVGRTADRDWSRRAQRRQLESKRPPKPPTTKHGFA